MVSADVETRIRSVGTQLSSSFRALVDALPEQPRRPQQLAAALGVNRNVSGRILALATANDPLLAIDAVPSLNPIWRALSAARGTAVPDAMIDEAESSLRAYEQLVTELAGDRSSFDALLSSMLPAARERFELSAKHSLFRGASLYKGAMADTWFHTAIVHPSSEDPTMHDVAYVYGTLGLRRLRPRVVVKFAYRQFGTPTSDWFGLDGAVLSASSADALDAFCPGQPGRMRLEGHGNGARLTLEDAGIGPDAAVDKVLGELRPSAMSRVAAETARNAKSLFVAPVIPVKQLVFDVLLHEDVYPGSEPSLRMYDTVVEGLASVNDASRDPDVLDSHEELLVLGRDARRYSMVELPRYGELLAHACDALNWDPSGFRGYRCRVQYPMHGCQVCMVLDV